MTRVRPRHGVIVLRGAGAMLAIALGLTSCGRKAEPAPPVIRRAETTRDLTVAQVGAQAVLEWGYPAMTSAGGSLPDLEAIELWRVAVPLAQEPVGSGERDRQARQAVIENQGERLAVLEVEGLAAATRGARLEYPDDLDAWRAATPERDPNLVLWYAVRSRCCGGRLSELSNVARLRPEEPPPPPEDSSATPGEPGIELTWRVAEGLGVVVERSPDGLEWTAVTAEPVSGASWLDTNAAQGQQWIYRLRSARATTGAVPVVGPPSPQIVVDHVDRYPPEPPEEVVCLPEGRLIRVRWRPSPEAVAYRVSRQSGGAGWQTLVEGLTTPELDDDDPPPGELTYAVVGVDAAGNASEPATCSAVTGAAP
jgi:hypothetical protein